MDSRSIRFIWSRDYCDFFNALVYFLVYFLLQNRYDSLPPSMARFSASDPNVIIYVGYGMQKQVLFYNLAQKKVIRMTNSPSLSCLCCVFFPHFAHHCLLIIGVCLVFLLLQVCVAAHVTSLSFSVCFFYQYILICIVTFFHCPVFQ